LCLVYQVLHHAAKALLYKVLGNDLVFHW
jgi:hypothetical protein